jgi:uncharacterized protein with NRDE domain
VEIYLRNNTGDYRLYHKRILSKHGFWDGFWNGIYASRLQLDYDIISFEISQRINMSETAGSIPTTIRRLTFSGGDKLTNIAAIMRLRKMNGGMKL